VLSQSPEQIAEVSAEPLEYLLLRSPDLGSGPIKIWHQLPRAIA
jgi:hypothetical protein